MQFFILFTMMDAMKEHEGIVSIGGRTITNLHSADDVDGLTGEESEKN